MFLAFVLQFIYIAIALLILSKQTEVEATVLFLVLREVVTLDTKDGLDASRLTSHVVLYKAICVTVIRNAKCCIAIISCQVGKVSSLSEAIE